MLEQLLTLSRQMLALARQGEWEQVTALQAERQQLLEKSFPLDMETVEADQAAREIHAIQELDRQLLQLAGTQREEIGHTLGRLNQGRAATRAYRDTSRR